MADFDYDSELCSVTNCKKQAVDYNPGNKAALCAEHAGIDTETERYGDALQNLVGES